MEPVKAFIVVIFAARLWTILSNLQQQSTVTQQYSQYPDKERCDDERRQQRLEKLKGHSSRHCNCKERYD
jgi:hypothetical protein